MKPLVTASERFITFVDHTSIVGHAVPRDVLLARLGAGDHPSLPKV
jgi:hypothetical protein